MQKIVLILMLAFVSVGLTDCVTAKKGCKKNYKKIKKMKKENPHFMM